MVRMINVCSVSTVQPETNFSVSPLMSVLTPAVGAQHISHVFEDVRRVNVIYVIYVHGHVMAPKLPDRPGLDGSNERSHPE
jgi:hypothetical protein